MTSIKARAINTAEQLLAQLAQVLPALRGAE